MSLYRDEGVVLRTQKLGEADRIVTLLTREHGRVRAVAKGVRRTTSRFGARLEPFMHVDLQLVGVVARPQLRRLIRQQDPGRHVEPLRVTPLLRAPPALERARGRIEPRRGALAHPLDRAIDIRRHRAALRADLCGRAVALRHRLLLRLLVVRFR